MLPELGFYHYKARAYSPTLGRFLQTDPVGYDDQVNLYAYVANDPVNKVDLDGKRVVIVGPADYREKVAQEFRTIQSKPDGAALANGLVRSSNVITITPHSMAPPQDRNKGNFTVAMDGAKARNGEGTGSKIFYDPTTKGGVDINGSDQRPSFVGLGHELGHAEDNDNGEQKGNNPKPDAGTTPLIERNAIFRENQIRSEHGIPSRPFYFPLPRPPERCDANGRC